MIPMTPHMRFLISQVYQVSFRDVQLLVLAELIQIQADCSCIVEDSIVDECFVQHVQQHPDLYLVSYQPGRIHIVTSTLLSFHDALEDTLRKANLLGLEGNRD